MNLEPHSHEVIIRQDYVGGPYAVSYGDKARKVWCPYTYRSLWFRTKTDWRPCLESHDHFEERVRATVQQVIRLHDEGTKEEAARQNFLKHLQNEIAVIPPGKWGSEVLDGAG